MSGSVTRRIDKARQEAEANKAARSGRLGAGVLGNRCLRQVWYGFRKVYQVKHQGRLLRLFDRGHQEEDRFNRYLRGAGYQVRDYSKRLWYHAASDAYLLTDWDFDESEWVGEDVVDVHQDPAHIKRATDRGQGPEQWTFSDHEGHFAGYTDGKVRGPDLPEGWGALEYKTHSDKSFKDLAAKGVLTSKPVHYVQMQMYMHYLELPWCLYLAVNKNDDTIYEELVYYKPELASQYRDIAGQIIWAKSAPPRITTDPSWYECKFCDYREICHYDEAPLRNCRSCAYAAPAEAGTWYCGLHHATIPKEFQPVGCDRWQGVK